MTPKVRQTIYQIGAIVPALLGIVLIWGGIDAGAADSISQIVTGFVTMLGSAPPAIAASTVSKQAKDGTFDTLSPTEQVVNGVTAVIAAQAAATADLEKVKSAVTGAVGIIPGIGPLAQQVINSVNLPTQAYSQFTDTSAYQAPWNR